MSKFKGVNNFGDTLVSSNLEANMLAYLNYGLLCVGAFSNVSIPTSGAYGGNAHQLAPVHDPRFQDGQVWQGFRQDWVWESGIDYAYQPIPISGVYVGGAFQPNGVSGTYAFHVDYPQGRVVFASPLPTTSAVTCEYSFRNVHCTTADAPWWQEIQFNSFRVDDGQFQQIGSGEWNVLAQNRIQLPCLVVQPVMRTRQVGLEIGSFSTVYRQDVLFHIIAETDSDRKQLHDILVAQWEQRIDTFDKDLLAAANAFPLIWDGSRNPSGVLQYPTLVSRNGGYYWRQVRFVEIRSEEIESPLPLYRAQVRATLETDMP